MENTAKFPNVVFSAEKLKAIQAQANLEAVRAAQDYLNKCFQGRDGGACGFAWVEIYGIKGNTRQGRQFKKAGIERNYCRVLSMFNPSGMSIRSIDAKEAGALAAAEVWREHGFNAFACSRITCSD